MAFTFVINGTTFTEANLEGVAYADEATGFPGMIAAILGHVENAWKGTSTSSLAVSTGSKSLSTQAGRSFVVGGPVRIARTSAPTTTFMDGIVTAYTPSTGALTVTVSAVVGSGTFTDWTIGFGTMTSVAPGATPVPVADGGTGASTASAARTNLDVPSNSEALLKTGNLSGLASASTARTNLGLGGMAVEATADWLSKAGNLSGLANAATARTNLGLGTAATLAVGTGANNIVQLTAAAKLPAVDASLLINLPAGTPSVPSGSKVAFYQAAAPSGWTRDTSSTVQDRVILLTNATDGGTTGGDWNPGQNLAVQGTAITVNQMPAHTHTVASSINGQIIATVTAGGNLTAPSSGITAFAAAGTDPAGGGQTHTHTLTDTQAWRPKHLKFILCTKD